MPRRFLEGVPAATAAFFAVGAALLACGVRERPAHLEDAARTTVPLPACVVSLQARRTATALRNLTEDEVWHVLFPRYDAARHELPAAAEACTGQHVFDDPIFAGATPLGAVIAVKEGDVAFGNAGDRVRVVWLRTHHFPDGSEAGPLAIVRATETSAEVYAVGVHRHRGKAAFQAERVGTEMLVTAVDDGCEGQPKTNPCASTVTLFLPRLGRLERLQTLTTEQRAFRSGAEPGVLGQLEYRLTASPEYGSSGVKVFEQIEAKDSGGHVLHKMDLERSFVLTDGALHGGPESLWTRVLALTPGNQAPKGP
jgi:hypothetical protein